MSGGSAPNASRAGLMSFSTPVSAAVVGHNVGSLAAELADKKLERAYAVDHALLERYTADGYTAPRGIDVGTAQGRIDLGGGQPAGGHLVGINNHIDFTRRPANP